jgi:hypothetical protein
MKRTLLAIALLLMAAHRLPAPISEEPEATPAPKPKREVVSKQKPKAEPTSKPTATPNRSFAGTWTGTTANQDSNGNSSSTLYSVEISDDEKTVLVNSAEAGTTISGPPAQAACTRFREALTWSFSGSDGMTTYSLRINGNGTANFHREGKYTGGDYDGLTYTHNGTFSRQDASSAPPVLQTATTPITNAAAKNAGGLPTAKPVPNKPGFVYNPFDSNTKVLLDVRSKTAGTKVKDPFSGKLFIVP